MLHNMLRAAAGRDRIPTDGLVAWYTMDNISGSTLVDEMGNYNGTINGATQVAGHIGQALSFDGNDFVDLGEKFDFIQNTGQFTWNTWLLLDNYNDGNLYSFAGNTLSSSSKGFWFSYDDRTSQGDRLVRLFLANGASIVSDIQASIAQPNGVYGMITLQGDGSSAYLYIDNVLIASQTYLAGLSTGNADRNATIGKSNWSSTGIDEWVGDIDETLVYNRALTSSERQTLLDRGA